MCYIYQKVNESDDYACLRLRTRTLTRTWGSRTRTWGLRTRTRTCKLVLEDWCWRTRTRTWGQRTRTKTCKLVREDSQGQRLSYIYIYIYIYSLLCVECMCDCSIYTGRLNNNWFIILCVDATLDQEIYLPQAPLVDLLVWHICLFVLQFYVVGRSPPVKVDMQ